jgi:hypothetical protein
MLRRETKIWAMLVIAAALALAGCKPEIGDECSVSTDCSTSGDRLCDTTQPGGYCTIFNCEPGTCPSEAVCIGFQTSTSKVCEDPQAEDRLQRTYCLRNCDTDGDCRSGYSCVNLSAKDNPWGAKVMESGSVNGKVCIVPYSGVPIAETPNTEVCTGTDAGFDVTPWEPDAGVVDDAGDDASDADTEAGGDAADDAADGGTDAADGGLDASSDA